MKVSEILGAKGANVFSVHPDATIASAVDVLGERNVGAVLVRDQAGAVVGILSERDVVRHLRDHGAGVLEHAVSRCMTPNPHTCPPDTTINALMAMMSQKRIRHMPVMDGEQLVGLVSIGDVVKRKIEETEREAAALKEYISA